jgi:hypothetical protein
LWEQIYGCGNKSMVVGINLLLWEQIYGWGTNLWLWEPNYGMNNKNEVMNKYVGAKKVTI